MKKKSMMIFGLLAAVLAFSLVLAGCDDGSTGGSGGTGGGGGGEAPKHELTIRNLTGSTFSKIEVYASDAEETVGEKLAEKTTDTATGDVYKPDVDFTFDQWGGAYVIVRCYTAGELSYEKWDYCSSDFPVDITYYHETSSEA